MSDEALSLLGEKIEGQRRYLEHWRQPAEPLLFQMVRTLDNLFCEELFFEEGTPERTPKPQYTLSSWGVNKALSLMISEELPDGPFRLFDGSGQPRAQADEFLLQAGILQRAETLEGWLREGLLGARIDHIREALPSGTEKILVLKSEDLSMFGEVVARTHRAWISDLTVEHDEPLERELQQRHAALESQLERSVGCFGGWGIGYTTTDEIDNHFLDIGGLYLRRMWSQDLLGTDDEIGGEPFGDYLGVLAALAGRAQKHLCYASILKRRRPDLQLRNLLTTFSPCTDLIDGLAAHLDAETTQIEKLLRPLVIGPDNRDVHTVSGDMTWAPIIRSSVHHYILPVYGLEINPFLFLLKDLQARFQKDWFRAANNREQRWLADLNQLFAGNRWQINDRNLKLREGGKTVTDIDYIAYDREHDQLAIFQLKWQHPVGMDNRARRSAGKNLVSQGNDWVERVLSWLDRNGLAEFGRRAGFSISADTKVYLFVVARYNAFFSGFSSRDDRAVWADWNHLMRVRYENPRATIADIASLLRTEAEEISQTYPGESYALPLGNLAVILNPETEP
ncbi:hypothetical protein N5A93_06470 [Roseovarius sp. EGI FJ00037]|uniref:hypothetical protein n=1 Tax=Roseovarius salincola TaxID=2978479 RepID=UPI0022A86058|nr:hypothetical protein [Roseovarius sp. EGI FJ00037]MCZ0811869.1 hypothetical protein [Roseovarius sp. EGI FJ00037]